MSESLECKVCDGSGMLMVPDSDGESASEQACPDPVHELPECLASHCPPRYDGICDWPKCAPGEQLDTDIDTSAGVHVWGDDE